MSMIETNERSDARAIKAGDDVVSCISLARTILNDLMEQRILVPFDQTEQNQQTLQIAQMLLESVVARRNRLEGK